MEWEEFWFEQAWRYTVLVMFHEYIVILDHGVVQVMTLGLLHESGLGRGPGPGGPIHIGQLPEICNRV